MHASYNKREIMAAFGSNYYGLAEFFAEKETSINTRGCSLTSFTDVNKENVFFVKLSKGIKWKKRLFVVISSGNKHDSFYFLLLTLLQN